MKTLSRWLIILGIVGILAGMGSCFAAFYLVVRKGNLVSSVPLVIGEEKKIDNVQLGAGSGAVIGVFLRYTSNQYGHIEGRSAFDKSVLFRFPVSYEIFDDSGKSIAVEQSEISPAYRGLTWGRSSYESSRAPATGTGEIEAVTKLFQVPASGKISVRILVKPDEKYGAQGKDPELRIYDHILDAKPWTVASVVLLFAGGGFAVVGLLLGLASRGKTSPPQ